MQRILWGAVLSLVGSVHAWLGAQCLYNVSTGYDNAGGAVLPEGVPDDAYTFTDDGGRGPAPALTGGTSTGFPIPPWIASSDRSLWVSSAANSIDLPAVYTYRIRFDLTRAGPQKARVLKMPDASWAPNSGTSRWVGIDGETSVGPAGQYLYEVQLPVPAYQNPFRLSLKGSWAAAGRGMDVLLNGVSLRLPEAGPGTLGAFPAGAGHGLFKMGQNSLQFVVVNAAPGPTGLRVDAELETRIEANPLDISTGFDEAAGLALNDFDADDDYLVITEFENVATVLGPDAPIPPWIPNSPSSRWIGLLAASTEPGVYQYRLQVTLTKAQAFRAYLSGVWAVDDQGLNILINDQPTGIVNQGAFTGYTAFPADAGLGMFEEGLNSIDFLVENGGAAANPGGLRVDGMVALKVEIAQPKFRRGDSDVDGFVSLSDPIGLLSYLFLAGAKPACLDAADIDDDGAANITDAIASLTYQFLAGDSPAPPGPHTCGPDVMEEPADLGCDQSCDP